MNAAAREFVTAIRSPRSLVLLLGPAVLLSILVLLRWPSESVVTQFGARSLEVFRVFGYGLCAAVCLIAPVTPAVSLVKERLRGLERVVEAAKLLEKEVRRLGGWVQFGENVREARLNSSVLPGFCQALADLKGG